MTMIIMKKVPRKTDVRLQKRILKSWCNEMYLTHIPKDQIRILAAKDMSVTNSSSKDNRSE